MIKVTLTKLQYSPSDKSLLPTISNFQYIERYNYYCYDKYQYFYFWLQFQYLDVTFYCYSLIWIEKYLKTRMPSTLFKNLLYAIWSFNRPIRALSRPQFSKRTKYVTVKPLIRQYVYLEFACKINKKIRNAL